MAVENYYENNIFFSLYREVKKKKINKRKEKKSKQNIFKLEFI